MNIKRIKIDGFKNLKNIDLTLNNITSLLSINSYGKTNTLTALKFGFDFIISNTSWLNSFSSAPIGYLFSLL